jgi:hypothetical protein
MENLRAWGAKHRLVGFHFAYDMSESRSVAQQMASISAIAISERPRHIGGKKRLFPA